MQDLYAGSPVGEALTIHGWVQFCVNMGCGGV